MFLFYSKCMFFLWCLCMPIRANLVRFGFAVLLLVSLKRNSNRIVRVISPLFCLRYMKGTTISL